MSNTVSRMMARRHAHHIRHASQRGAFAACVVMSLCASIQGQWELPLVVSANPGIGYGSAFGPIGDLTGSGLQDFFVSAPKQDLGSVTVRVDGVLFSGALGSSGDMFGASALAIGDLTGDGVSEIAVGAPDYDLGHGQVRVLVQMAGVNLLYPLFVIDGDEPGGALGWGLVAVGDVDGDGTIDFAVSSPFADVGGVPGGGLVRVLNGQKGFVITEVEGEGHDQWFGYDIARAGDIDGDGAGDVVVSSRGLVSVISGRDGSALVSIPCDFSVESTVVAGGFDSNGDGVPDVAVGSPEPRDGAGTVSVYSGTSGKRLWTVVGASPGDSFGASLGTSGDIDGDARDDLVIGAPGMDGGGGVVIVSSRTGLEFRKVPGLFDSWQMGVPIVATEDFNGDGITDVMTSAGCAPNLGSVAVLNPLADGVRPFGVGTPPEGSSFVLVADASPEVGSKVNLMSGGVGPGASISLLVSNELEPIGVSAGELVFHVGLGAASTIIAPGVALSGDDGEVLISLRVPDEPALIGSVFGCQLVAQLPGAESGGLVSSRGLELTIQ